MHYNDKSLCVRCTHLRPALDPNIQKAYLGKCVKREFPFTLAITLQGWSECEVFQDSGKAYVPPDPAVATAAAAAKSAKGAKRVEFYYSSKQKSGELFPCDNNKALELVHALKAAGVDAKAIDVADVKDRFPVYHKSVSGPDATVRPVFGAKGALVEDFGTNVPALLVFEGDRYPTFAFPRSDAKRGTIRVEQALEDLIAETKGAAVGAAHD
ncbi:MAG: hypothetical protein LAN64_07510 [Acidobacteriia bacterium]|nr:hypothetical protein [Terriglobia bacterium]